MSEHLKLTVVTIVLVASAMFAFSRPSRAKTAPPSPVSAVESAAENTIRGEVVGVNETSVTIDADGLVTTIVVPESCIVQKDRRTAELEALVPGDWLDAVVSLRNDSAVADKIAAFSVR